MRGAKGQSKSPPAAGSTRKAVTMRAMRIVPAIFCAVLLAGSAAAQTPHTHQHTFKDAEKWSHVFDDPERDAWQKPHQVIQALALKPDARIADLGAGTGYFAARLANMLPKGRVYAVDVEPDMVRFLAERAKREDLRNLTPVAGAPDDPRLPEKVDVILLVDVYHHIEDRERYFRKLSQSLRPGGRIAIIDFTLDSPQGPPPAARVAPGKVKAEMKAAGHALAAEHRFLPYQYYLVFQPAS
jgi:SAM-dependent methyltransferase